jgi:hypothetical protein
MNAFPFIDEEVLERGEEEGAELAAAWIGQELSIPIKQPKQEALYGILRIRRHAPACPGVEVRVKFGRTPPAAWRLTRTQSYPAAV